MIQHIYSPPLIDDYIASSYLERDSKHVDALHDFNTRLAEEDVFFVPKFKREAYKNSPLVRGIRTRNRLANFVKTSHSSYSFEHTLQIRFDILRN